MDSYVYLTNRVCKKIIVLKIYQCLTHQCSSPVKMSVSDRSEQTKKFLSIYQVHSKALNVPRIFVYTVRGASPMTIYW